MVIWLAIEATDRILYKHDEKLDAGVMLITSLVSLACNIFNLFALGHVPCCSSKDGNFMDSVQSIYKPHGGHSCSHHHHGHGHGHGHSHNHGGCSGHGHKHDNHDHKHDEESGEHKKCSHSHNHHDHKHGSEEEHASLMKGQEGIQSIAQS